MASARVIHTGLPYCPRLPSRPIATMAESQVFTALRGRKVKAEIPRTNIIPPRYSDDTQSSGRVPGRGSVRPRQTVRQR